MKDTNIQMNTNETNEYEYVNRLDVNVNRTSVAYQGIVQQKKRKRKAAPTCHVGAARKSILGMKLVNAYTPER